MAFPAPLDPPIYKLSLIMKGGGQGWTENIYYKPGLTNTPAIERGNVEDALLKLAGVVAEGMRRPNEISKGRYALATARGQGRLKVNGFPITGVITNSQPDAPWTDIFLSVFDATSSIRRTWTQSGIPISWTVFSPGGDIVPGSPADLTAWVQRFKDFLTGQLPAVQLAQGTWALRFREKNPATNPLYKIVGMDVDDVSDTYKFVIIPDNPNAPTVTWAVGMQITIAGVRDKCLRKVNGQATIIKVETNTPVSGQTTITTSKPNCCGFIPTIKPTPKWKIQQSTFAFAAIDDVVLAGAGPHKRGKFIGQRAGRRSGTCCR